MNETNIAPFERNQYFYGKLLTARDFALEQTYHSRKRQLLNRLLHGAGVVCGLGVSAADDSTLMIESGMAMDYSGREILVPELLLRKLQMLEGQETLAGKPDAYLCLAYGETAAEPVNATGVEMEHQLQHNLIREGYRLFLTTEAPDYGRLLEAAGEETVRTLYQSEELTLILSAPRYVCGGQEFSVQVLVVKTEKTPPVQFTLEGESAVLTSETGRVRLSHGESRQERRLVYTVEFCLETRRLQQLDGQMFSAGCELNVTVGGHSYRNYLTLDLPLCLCADPQALQQRRRSQDMLERHLQGVELPIYLAKLELIQSSGGVFLGQVTPLPFGQLVEAHRAETQPAEEGPMTVTTSVKALEYWQKPDAKAVYQPSSRALHLEFAIPSPEQYDYAVCHGTVDLTMPGGIRVNSRVFSEEIPHGLGAGAVDIRLSVEFLDGDTPALLYGNSEVFKSKQMKVNAPWVEAAALVYPERGTMRIGLWLHDSVDGNAVRVHYFAQKPERDTSRILANRAASLTVTPEFSRIRCRETLQFRAGVTGTPDQTVAWSVREELGGVIDQNGCYQAPEVPGTYEVVAQLRSDSTVTASAFVIVEA